MNAWLPNTDWAEIARAGGDTLLMLGGSLVLTAILGLPLSVLLFLTGPRQLLAQPAIYASLSFAVNVLRSVPFIILIILMMPDATPCRYQARGGRRDPAARRRRGAVLHPPGRNRAAGSRARRCRGQPGDGREHVSNRAWRAAAGSAARHIRRHHRVDLDIKVFTDYVQPNLQGAEKRIDVNYFQTQPYLAAFNPNRGTDLVIVTGVHVEPFGAIRASLSRWPTCPTARTS